MSRQYTQKTTKRERRALRKMRRNVFVLRELEVQAMRTREAAKIAHETAERASMILLVALYASGGSIVIDKVQIDAVESRLATMDYSIVDGPDPETFKIALVESPVQAATEGEK